MAVLLMATLAGDLLLLPALLALRRGRKETVAAVPASIVVGRPREARKSAGMAADRVA
jgi:hypothetical protein